MVKDRAHIVKHINRVPTWSMMMRLCVIVVGILGLLFFDHILQDKQNSWWHDLVFILTIIAGIMWAIFGLLSWKRVECDTHRQLIICEAFLHRRVELSFDFLYKIQVQSKGQQPIEHYDQLLESSSKRVKFISKQGDFISVENTDKFNHVIYNFLSHIPLDSY